MSLIKTSQKKIAKGTETLSQAISLKSYRKLAINFLILTVNLIIIILYFTLSQAKISIVPEKETFVHKLQIPIKEIVAEGDKAISGKILEQTITASETFNIESETEIPTIATGEITIYNKTASRSQKLMASTQFGNSNGVIIRLKEGVEVLPGATVTLAAYADKEGVIGEVEPGKFEIIKLKSDKDKIYGEVTKKFTGGSKSTKMISQETMDNAKKTIEKKLKNQAIEKIKNLNPDANDNDITVTITSFVSSAKVNDLNIENFTVTAEGVARLIVFDKEMAKTITKEDLVANLSANKIVSQVDEGSFTAQPDPSATFLDTSISANLIPKFPEEIFNKKDIIGLNRDEVRKYFRKITGIDNVEVNFSPFWVRSVPSSEDHVIIEVKK